MSFIEWNTKMSVNVEEIDIQHKNLVNIINEIYDMMKQNSFEDQLKEVFNRLVLYTIYHFKTEEAYMEMVNYDGLEKHIKEHQKFVNRLKRLKSRCHQGKQEILVELSSFLSGWMISHILHSDKKYSEVMLKPEWLPAHKKSA